MMFYVHILTLLNKDEKLRFRNKFRYKTKKKGSNEIQKSPLHEVE